MARFPIGEKARETGKVRVFEFLKGHDKPGCLLASIAEGDFDVCLHFFVLSYLVY